MKRAAWLLVALFSAWLFSRTAVSAPVDLKPSAVATVCAGKLVTSVEQVSAPSAPLLVARAPLLGRVPVVPPTFGVRRSWARVAAPRIRDLRQAVRRAQTRRRVPRLSGGEPPWS